MQKECHWPSGRAIRRLNSANARAVLARFGVEGGDVELMDMSELRELVRRLKRESHERGDCECPAAAYIRAGGGAA